MTFPTCSITRNPRLFLVDEAQCAEEGSEIDPSAVCGDMPRNSKVGFLFAKNNAADQASFNRTVAHELGHGAFAWQHPFDLTEEGISTNNLMDYVKDDELAYFQWQSTLGLNLTWGFLEGDEEGMVKSSIVNAHYIVTDDNALEKDANGTNKKNDQGEKIKIAQGLEVVALSTGGKNQKIQTLPDKVEKYTNVSNLTKINGKTLPVLYYSHSEINSVRELPLSPIVSKKHSIGSLIKYYADFTYNKITYYCISKPNVDNYTGEWIENMDDFARKVCDLPTGDKRKVGDVDLKASDFVTTPYGSTQYAGNAIDLSKFTKGKEFEVMASCGKYYLVKGTRVKKEDNQDKYDAYEGAWVSRNVLEFCVTNDDLNCITGKTISMDVVKAINKYCGTFFMPNVPQMANYIGQICGEATSELNKLYEEESYSPLQIVRIFGRNMNGHLFEEAKLNQSTQEYTYEPINYNTSQCAEDGGMAKGSSTFSMNGEQIANAYADYKVEKTVKVNGVDVKKLIYVNRNDVIPGTSGNLKALVKKDGKTNWNYNEGRIRVKVEFLPNGSSNLFDVTYACRNQNGNYNSKDGSTYKGSGFIHLTWKSNYLSVVNKWNELNPNDKLTLNSDLINKMRTDIDFAMKFAMTFWLLKQSKISAYLGDNYNEGNIENITFYVNGSKDGNGSIDNRKKYAKKGYEILE